jgi:AcrR family transcriptional regulator
MGVKERHERERDAVRRAILDAARELFVSEGYEHVSMRRIAERIEYSPAAIYSYFPSKEDIFVALAEEGLRLFAGSGSYAIEGLTPVDRLRHIVLRLYRFSVEHPPYFALMFVDRTVPRICRERERFTSAREMRQELITELERAANDGVLPTTVPGAAVFRILTAGVLGVAVMRLSGRLTADAADALVNDVVNVGIAGLKTDITLTFDSQAGDRAHADVGK